MDTNADYSLTADSGSDTVAAVATLDNVTLTPAPSPRIPPSWPKISEPAIRWGVTPTTASTISIPCWDAVRWIVPACFGAEQFTGDFVLTVLQPTRLPEPATLASGIMIRDSMDDGPMAFVGRIRPGPIPSFVWRTNPKGGTGGLNGITCDDDGSAWFGAVIKSPPCMPPTTPASPGRGLRWASRKPSSCSRQFWRVCIAITPGAWA